MNQDIIIKYFQKRLGLEFEKTSDHVFRGVSAQRESPEYGWGYTVSIMGIELFGMKAISTCKAFEKSIKPEDLFSQQKNVLDQLHASGVPRHSARINRILTCQTVCYDKDTNMVARLATNDIDAFITFSKSLWTTPWTDSDFECEKNDLLRNIGDGIAYGVKIGNRLVSRCYAPHVSFLQEVIEEPGYDTLPEFRKRGFGSGCLAQTTRAIIEKEKVPLLTVDRNNVASMNTALSVGYQPIGELIEIIRQ